MNYPHAVLTVAGAAVLGVILLSIVGYSVHMLVLGSSTKRQLRRGFQSRLQPLRQLLEHAKREISRFEAALEQGTASISPLCIARLTTLRRIVASADNHLHLISRLAERGGHRQLLIAEEKFVSPVPVRDNCLEALIDEDPLPQRSLEEWAPHVCALLEDIERLLCPEAPQRRAA